jgi:hypothetical protein
MAKKALLGHNGDSISRGSADGSQNIIPDKRLVFLLKPVL